MRIEKKLLNKYELKGPRYTSYPTINNFNDIDDTMKCGFNWSKGLG